MLTNVHKVKQTFVKMQEKNAKHLSLTSVSFVTYQNHPGNQSGAGRLQSWNSSWVETKSGHPADS